ncbi:MAG: toxin-antitoxin system YwqK family antitoxin [Flavobacteriales bacterium]|nr:toxin-antitoxin system YwqK family antitoxin [Flavobacteriales bacterium]
MRKLSEYRFKVSHRIVVLSVVMIMIGGVTPLRAQEPADSLNQTDDQGRKQGHWIKYFPEHEKQVMYDGYFKNDLPIGLLKRYTPDGKLQAEMDYAADGYTIQAKLYHPNGQLMATGGYIGKVKDGEWTYYNEAGKKTSHEGFKQGVSHGSFEEYYPSTGATVNQLTWVDGVKQGPWIQQFESGKLKLKANYEKGHLEGDITFYYPEGGVQMKGQYVAGMKQGTWKYFLEDGRLASIIGHKDGDVVSSVKVNGTFTEHYPGRIPSKVENYRNGKLDGDYLVYYKVGEWVVNETTNKDGEVERVEELKGQQLKMKANYVEGKLEGEVTYYKPDGSVDKVEKYVGGEKQ